MKMRYVFVMVFINFILMSTIFQQFRINGVMPNFIIIFSIIFAVLYSEQHGYVFAIISGLLQDTFLGKVLFINTVIYIFLVFLAVRVERIMFKGNDLTPFFMIGFSTLIYHLTFFLFMFFLQSAIPIHQIASKIVTETILNIVIGLFVYRVIFKRVFGYRLGDYNA